MSVFEDAFRDGQRRAREGPHSHRLAYHLRQAGVSSGRAEEAARVAESLLAPLDAPPVDREALDLMAQIHAETIRACDASDMIRAQSDAPPVTVGPTIRTDWEMFRNVWSEDPEDQPDRPAPLAPPNPELARAWRERR